MYQARPRPRASRSGGEGSNHDATSFIKSPFLLHVSVTFLKMQVPFFSLAGFQENLQVNMDSRVLQSTAAPNNRGPL